MILLTTTREHHLRGQHLLVEAKRKDQTVEHSVDIMYVSLYNNMLGTNELRTSWINPNPTGRFSEFGGFRPAIYRI